MANKKPLGNMIVNLGLDSTAFSDGLEGAKKAVAHQTSAMKAQMSVLSASGSELDVLQAKYEGLSQIQESNRAVVEKTRKAYEDSLDKSGKATKQTAKLASAYNNAQKVNASYEKQIQATSQKMAKLTAESNEQVVALRNQAKQFEKAGQQIQDFGQKADKLGNILSVSVTAPLTAMAVQATKTAKEMSSSQTKIQAAFNLTDKEASKLQKSVNDVFTSGFVESVDESNEAVIALVNQMPELKDASSATVTQMVKDAKTLEKLYGSDMEETFRGANALMKTFGVSGEEAFDLIATASANGLDKTHELGDNLAEYATLFEQSGYSAEQMFEILESGLDAGAYNLDKVNDLVKEFGIRMSDGSVESALEDMDEASQKMFAQMQKDGLSNREMFTKIVTEISKVEDEQKQATLISNIFGTQGEDAGIQVMEAMAGVGDVNKDVKGSYDDVTGAADDMVDSMAETVTWQKALNELMAAGGELGNAFAPYIEDLAQGVSHFAEAFANLDEQTQSWIIKAGVIAAASGPALKVFNLFADVTGKAAKGIGSISSAMANVAAKKAEAEALQSYGGIAEEVGEKAFKASSKTAGIGAVGGAITETATAGAAAASSEGGIGLFSAALAELNPIVLGLTGTAGAVTLGYGVWKGWGEEALTAKRSVEKWGTDLGPATETMEKISDEAGKAKKNFGLFATGVTENSDAVVKSFDDINSSISEGLTAQNEAVEGVFSELPEFAQSALEDVYQTELDSMDKSKSSLENNITEIAKIKKNAADNNRDVTATELAKINDLTEANFKIGLNQLDLTKKERKKILDAMNGDLTEVTEEEAKTWTESLGLQRRELTASIEQNRKSLKKGLEDTGRFSDETISEILNMYDEAAKTQTDGIDQQIAILAEKYPELARQIDLQTGKSIEGNRGLVSSLAESNDEIIENAKTNAEKLSSNAQGTLEEMNVFVDSSVKGANVWNSLVYDEKTGNIKTNADEVVAEAMDSEKKWDKLLYLTKQANVSSNVKTIIAEAAIQSGRWNELSWAEKKAMISSNSTATMVKALEDKGTWDSLSYENKKLILESNSKEELAVVMAQLSLWDEYQPQIKKLNADNANFISEVLESEERMKAWNDLPVKVKKLLANTDNLKKKLKDGEISIEDYNKVDPELKKLAGDNQDALDALKSVKESIINYNSGYNPEEKKADIDTNALDAASDVDDYLDSWDSVPASQTKKAELQTSVTGDILGDDLSKMLGYKDGTDYHPGGPAVVNDQKGPTYKELIQLPNGKAFIPRERNALINLPKGSSVLKASETRKMFPHYANGVGAVSGLSLDTLVKSVNILASVIQSNTNAIAGVPVGSPEITQLTVERLLASGGQYFIVGQNWVTNMINGWNSLVPTFLSTEQTFVLSYLKNLKNQNKPNYNQGREWTNQLTKGWNSLTGSFINVINAFIKNMDSVEKAQNKPMYNNGRAWMQNNLNGFNSLYSTFIKRVDKLGSESVSKLRSHHSDFYNAGKYLTQGLIDGSKSLNSSLDKQMKSIANTMVKDIGKGVNGVISGVNYVMEEVDSDTKLSSWDVPHYAKGTPSTKGAHPGGLAMVNDQKGSNYEEFVKLPDGRGFIPEGRDRLLNLPKGTHVVNATQTKKFKKKIPRYADGTSDFDVADLVGEQEKTISFLDSKVDYAGMTKTWKSMTKAGVKKMGLAANELIQSELNKFFAEDTFNGDISTASGNANGVYQYLVDIANDVISKYPDFVITSGYRAGDQYYHGKRQAIDIAIPGVTTGSSRYTKAANYAYNHNPSKIAYVITNNKVRDRKGFSGTGVHDSWETWPSGGHMDHVHLNGALGSGDIAKSTSSGVEQWRGVSIKALKMTDQYSASNLDALLYQMQTESGGNQYAINTWDSNAKAGTPSKGLMQVIDPTFKAYAFSDKYDDDIYDPLSNILASIDYTLARYGSLANGWKGHGYENGGLITKQHLAMVGEGNKAEMVLPLTNKTRSIELMGQAIEFLYGRKSPKTNAQSPNKVDKLEQKFDKMIDLLQALVNKDTSIVLDGKDVSRSSNKHLGHTQRLSNYMGGV